MKYLGLLLTAVLATPAAYAQAYDASMHYEKKKQQALAIDYNYPTQAVENAIVQKFSKMGYKAKEEKGLLNRDKGFLVYKNIYIPDISSERLDYLFKVKKKSRKEKDESILYLIMMKDDRNALAMMDTEQLWKAKSYLNNLLPDVEAADLELKIQAEADALAKYEKKLRELKEEQLSLEKKLSQNKSDQEATQKEIELHRKALSALEARRKPLN